MAEPARTIVVTPDELRAIIRDELARATPATPDEWMTSEEVAKMLGVKRTTLPALVTRERLPCYRPGKGYTFRRSEVEAWLVERASKPGSRSKGKLRMLRGERDQAR